MSVAGYMGGTLVYRNQIGVDHRYADAGKWIEETGTSTRGVALAAAGESLSLNQMKLVHVDEERVVVARTEDGVKAFSDRCTHKGGPLSDGALMCGTVQCPWHGSQFDVKTGDVVCGPATEPVRVYPTT
jgi:nitrite reductase/ring-hydroxylating ferredoxin subunit